MNKRLLKKYHAPQCQTIEVKTYNLLIERSSETLPGGQGVVDSPEFDIEWIDLDK